MANGGRSRASRLRLLAGVVLAIGVAGGFALASMYPALVTGDPLSGQSVSWTQAPRGDASRTTFNWLLFMLVLGPAAVAAAVLYGASEVAHSVSRRSRSGRIRDSEDLELS
jgi:hypothetical protein